MNLSFTFRNMADHKKKISLISFTAFKKTVLKFDPENIDIKMKNKGGKRNNQNLHK